MRSTLTTLGIVIGVVTVTLMATAIEGLNQAFLKSISSIGSDVVYIEKFAWFGDEEWWKVRNRRDILLEDARQLARLAVSSLAVSPVADTFRSVRYNNRSASGVQIVGCGSEMETVGNLTLTAGRFLFPEEVDGARPVCVLGADLAANFFPHEPAIGRKIRIQESAYEVVGVVAKLGSFLGVFNMDNRVMVPITRFISDISRWPNVTIAVKVRNLDQIGDAVEELRGVMRRIRRLPPDRPDDFAVNQQDAFIKMFNRLSTTIASVGLFITGLSLFVGGIGIMNIMFVSVAERTKEIGLRKALGARRRTILIQFLMEAASLCLFGGVLGLVLAFPLSLLMSHWLPSSMSWIIVTMSLTIALLTGLVAGFMPAYRAARLSPVEAMRNE
ncbi:MAG TPA: ABC transporter permease [Candidatus Paceibacterota bacterium]|nr:ABC transporter permease [Verrucomicrobiota bacterium]HRY48102.1 ABC transporter permease [Candidatus Paceibacterota bacterium]